MQYEYKVSITSLTKYAGKWQFVVTLTDDYNEPERIECHTNNEGEGLWQWGKQTDGTTQFSLSGCTNGAARQRIVRRFQGSKYPA